MHVTLLGFFGFLPGFPALFGALAGPRALHELARHPVAQTVVAAVSTVLLWWVRPLLTGVGVDYWSVWFATHGGFALVLLAVSTGLSLWALGRRAP